MIRAIEDHAVANGLSEEARNAAKSASVILAMNNVYHRAIHLLSNRDCKTLRARLRMNVIANPGVDKTDFELWCTTVSASNGCAHAWTPTKTN